ncbi:uridine phosphorylase [Salegentibacter agarivorans]|jgi:uridine phosphorylase|uniref:Uridine phosphorylase n=1 Tax=Salegentibacter agarivorans TaxID=345907 RepID=A0A1I2KEC2_9FLAO|nr:MULTISPECIES: nucleoside phosphorylase [Salegentibacter]APS39610.1 phosphorylase [Salegentibacter sp. T436]SFF63567.1 uridine phosphorylase [Salegentibacter agarivorans]|tara:strand:+ start:122 stop:991 length:870 start_codon:yes stop_codon:yes gene_type:complete
MPIEASEFIQNSDGSVYHLNLLPKHLAKTVILVGDPNRVERITRHFDRVEFKLKKREFYTQTGYYKGKRISVISTGIGPDNIDIVLNELDALVNIDFETRELKKEITSLDIIRIGTSGSIQKEVPVDSFLISESAIGFDGLLHFYESEHIQNSEFADAFSQHLDWFKKKAAPYVVDGSEKLISRMAYSRLHKGVTATNIGFYGPQGRILRLALQDDKMNDKLASFSFNNKKITNLEMETSAIYGLSKLLGHNAISMNAIIANRAAGTFSKDPKNTVDELIQYSLEQLAK